MPSYRAENPQEFVTQENPTDPQNAMSDRKNQLEEAASDYIDVLTQGGAILGGDIVATQVFDMLDEQVLMNQNQTIRDVVNLVGPAALGVFVFNMTDSEVWQGVGVGHGLTSVRRIVDRGLGMLTGQNGGDSETSGYLPSPSGDGMSGRFLTEANASPTATAASGTVPQGETVTEAI